MKNFVKNLNLSQHSILELKMDGWIDGWVDGCKGAWVDGWVIHISGERLPAREIGRWMDGWMDDGWIRFLTIPHVGHLFIVWSCSPTPKT